MFYKYSALGNHFILIEGEVSNRLDIASLCKASEVGADGIIFLTITEERECNFSFYNKDGSKASVCGNALRVIAYHLNTLKKYDKNKYQVKIDGRRYEVGLDEEGYYAVFNQPRLLVSTDSCAFFQAPNYHIIRYVSRVDISRLYEIAYPNRNLFNSHELMKISENVYGFISYERGVGLTDSCVSGAICAYSFLQKNYRVNQPIVLRTIGGDIHLSLIDDKIKASGQIKLIYKGETYEEVS